MVQFFVRTLELSNFFRSKEVLCMAGTLSIPGE